jgi:hypothetical protein
MLRQPLSGRVLGNRVTSVSNPVPDSDLGGIVNTGSGTPLGNPNFPCAAGPEILPSESAFVPLDTGTAYIFQHRLNASGMGNSFCRATAEFAPFTDMQQHFVAFDLYTNQQAIQSIDTPTTVVLPLRTATGTNMGTGTILTAAATVLEALQNPGDNKFVSLDPTVVGTYLQLAFDPTELATNWQYGRVVSIGLRYVAWKDDDSAPTPSECFNLYVKDTVILSEKGIGTYLVQDYRHDSTFATKYLGETNPIPPSKAAWPSHDLHPFTVEDLLNMGAAFNEFFIKIEPAYIDLAQTTTNFDYFELVVEVIPEYRRNCAIRYVSNIWGDANNNGSYQNDVVWRYPFSSSFTNPLPTDDGDLFLVVREAEPASESDAYRARTEGQLAVAGMEAYGPSLQIKAVLQTRSADEIYDLLVLNPNEVGQIMTYKSAVTDQQVVPSTLEVFNEYRLSVAHYSPTVVTAGAFWASYRGMAGLEFQRVYDTAPRIQRVWLKAGVTYGWVRALVQPTSQALGSVQWTVYNNAVVVVASTPTYSVATIEAIEEQGNGWRELLLQLDTPVIPAVSDWYYIVVSSDTSSTQPWLIAAAEPTGLQPYFSYDVVPTGLGSGTARIIDYAMILTCTPPAIPAPTVDLQVVQLSNSSCGLTQLTYPSITWTPDGSYDQYVVVARTAAIDSAYKIKSLALTSGPAGVPQVFYDPSPAWDTPTEYAVIGHRGFDQYEAISAYAAGIVIPSQGAVLGLATITESPNLIGVYAPTSSSGSVEISWENLSPTEIVPLHNRDFQRSIHSIEDRGLSFSVTVLVDHFALCTGGEPSDLTVGQRSLDREVWDSLLFFANSGRVWVQFPGGRVESYIMTIGSMRALTEHGVFSAELNFVRSAGSDLGVVV